MTITNKAKIRDEHVNDVRSAMRHRATWLYFLLDEAEKQGLDRDDFGRKAIFRTGCFMGERGFKKTDDLQEFERQFVTDLAKKLFEMYVKDSTMDRFVV